MSEPETKAHVIRELSKSMINKIAAGEVIERPANAVKELLENAVDAGATRVDVEVEKGGVELLKVIDNGCGIPAEQIPLALAPHATSKISEPDDLFRIATLGFRGEALASIAEISHLTLTTRAVGSESGAKVRGAGGELGEVESSGRDVGTTIEVRDLFFNVPVRRRFLKSPTAEYGAIREAFVRVALANPEIAFSLRHNGSLDMNFASASTFLDRIRAAFGAKVAEQLLPIETRHPATGLELAGFVAKPSLVRNTAAMQYLFVNGRYFRDKALSNALKNAYAGLLKQGSFPVVFLTLTAPPDFVDVNVHPTKQEVRFADAQAIYAALLHGIREKLQSANMETRPTVDQIAAAAQMVGFNLQKGSDVASPATPHDAKRARFTPNSNASKPDAHDSHDAPDAPDAPPRELVFVPDPVNPLDVRAAIDPDVARRSQNDDWLNAAKEGSAQRRAAREAAERARQQPSADATTDGQAKRDDLDPDAVERTIRFANEALDEAARRAAQKERAAADAAQLTRLLGGKTAEFRKFPNLNDGPLSSRYGVSASKGPVASEAPCAEKEEPHDAANLDEQGFRKGSFGGRALDGESSSRRDLIESSEPSRALSYDERRARIRANSDEGSNSMKDRLVARSSDGRPVVQFCNRYLVMEAPDGIALVDQHALHERILYEKVKSGYTSKQVDVQRLLVPEAIDLSPTEYAYALEHKDLFQSLGLLVDAFGGSTVLVNGYPAVFANSSPREIFLAALAALYRNRGKATVVDLVEGAISQMACKGAIKAGDRLSPDAVAELVAQAEMELYAHHCPHGRPSTVVFTTAKLDQFFKRDNPGDPKRLLND